LLIESFNQKYIVNSYSLMIKSFNHKNIIKYNITTIKYFNYKIKGIIIKNLRGQFNVLTTPYINKINVNLYKNILLTIFFYNLFFYRIFFCMGFLKFHC